MADIVGNYLSAYYGAQDRQAAQQDRQMQMQRQQVADDRAAKTFDQQSQLNALSMAKQKHDNLVNILGRATDETSFQQGIQQAALPVEQGGLGLPSEQLSHLTYAKDYQRLRQESGALGEQLDVLAKQAGLRQTNAQIGLIGAQTDAAKANAEFIRTNKGNPSGKPLSTQMNNEFGTLGDTKSQVNNFLATFKPEFASRGVGFGFGANTMNAFDRATGGSEASTWWQGYDKYKNTVRHGLFGGALTPNEQAAFDAADIGPGMNDKTILANLAIQKQIVEGAIARRSNSAAAQGFNKEAIDALTGSGNYTINQGDTAGTVRGGSVPTVTTKAQYDALPSGSIYTESDGKRYRKP